MLSRQPSGAGEYACARAGTTSVKSSRQAVRVMPRGRNRRSCENASNDMPLTRSTIVWSKPYPEFVYE
jgi:hypothetical protein